MKNLFVKWLSALLVAVLLMSSAAMMEELPEAEIEEIVSEATEETIEEIEADLGVDDAPVLTAPSDGGEFELPDYDAAAEVPVIDEDQAEETEEYEVDMLVDSDTLFEGYVNGLFGLRKNNLFEARSVGGDLTGQQAALYTFLRACIVDIAAGRRASTQCTSTTGHSLSWNAISDVLNCLVADCPYEMFWFGNRAQYTKRGSKLTVAFAVSASFSAGSYKVNTAAIARANTAAANARAVVNQNASRSDYDKLLAYRNYICGAVNYNYNASSYKASGRMDPWQLIWVFDGDRSTNVVCEGYAEAFQYLCDMTTFRGKVMCYCVTGRADGGDHKWNIVRMPNGKNYHVDVTWCDQDSSGTYDWFFMKAPVSGSVGSSYSFSVTNRAGRMTGTYVYDSACRSLFSNADLTLSTRNYTAEAGLPAVSAPTPKVKVIAAKSGYTVNMGQKFQIDLNGANAKSFKSSKPKVASVNAVGVVTAKAKGKTKITIKIGKKKRVLTLTVKDPTIPTWVKLNMSGTVAAKKGTTVTLRASLPAGTNSGIKWTSSNKKVATVKNGVVTFKKAGKVTITATAIRGKKKAKVTFKVTK